MVTTTRMSAKTLNDTATPLLVALMEPMRTDVATTSISMGAMTKYKTFNGEEINGQKVWAYDFHNDDD